MKTGFLPCVMAVLLLGSCAGRAGEEKPEQWLNTPAFIDVMISDGFWSPMIERNRVKTIPYVFRQCELTGRIDNFAVAGGLKKGKHTGARYNDSDVFKIIEGACYSLMETPDPELRGYVDSLITLIAAAQEDDGYLYTTRTIDPVNMAPGAGSERWIDERVSHELYNVGHMYEAAVAHHQATGSRTFLDVALKNAELIYREFGWGRREIAPGHQEIEIGLIKLHRLTGDRRWLELAQFFIDVRGRPGEYIRHPDTSRFRVYNDSVYLQMHMPVMEQTEAVGHAVRGGYMCAAMADLSEATGYNRYLEASQRIWEDVTQKKIYITGGIGSKEYGEAFGEPYELPNMEAYTETCASVANVFWNHRLYRATGDAKYLDVLERTLYNGLISGISNDGCHFFYTNPLESDGSFERAGWFDCSCCPVNVARFMPALKQYVWSISDDGINVNLFISSEARVAAGAGEITLRQETEYPWKGDVRIEVDPDSDGNRFSLRVRIPAWTGDEPFEGGLYRYLTPEEGKVQITVNGKKTAVRPDDGFAVIERRWNRGDVVEVVLPMVPRFITAREEVKTDSGRVALGYGPLVYCLEEADNGPVRELTVKPDADIEFTYVPELPGGVGTLTFTAITPEGMEQKVKAVPYYSWNNRGSGEMTVWMKTKKQ
ncbi:MAG: glycoside hydrolase family 127 protein [Bacteroidales bacterium]|nr:glycoside hydrolase family 127 protein [Bacteroidales bacterium]MDT8373127.1 glycoside hydrolase family 127 protein [Bacteroidales bacterium]